MIFQHVVGRCGCRDGLACSTETPTYFAYREQTRQDGSFHKLEFSLRVPSAALTDFSLLSRSAMTYFHSSPCASTSLLFNSSPFPHFLACLCAPSFPPSIHLFNTPGPGVSPPPTSNHSSLNLQSNYGSLALLLV